MITFWKKTRASYSLSKLFFHTRSAFLESLKRAGASNLPEKSLEYSYVHAMANNTANQGKAF